MKTIKTIIALAFFSLIIFSTTAVQAADLYKDRSPNDSDLDGLTDQGETQIFLTDPNNPDSDNDTFLDGTEVLVGTNPLDINDPPQITPSTPQTNNSIPWTWYLARISGITGYILLFLLMMSGVGITTGYIFNLFGPIIAWRIHRTMGISLGLFIVIHLVTLFMDDFMNFSLAELLIPFVSDFKPIYISAGIIGFYLLIVIIITSIILIAKKYKVWRFLHYLTFPTFLLFWFHGVYTGTDSDTITMQIVYWTTGITAISAFVYRLIKIPSLKSSPRQKILDQISAIKP